MGLGKLVKNQVTSIGKVTGSAWHDNSSLHQKHFDTKKPDGSSKKGLTIKWDGGEFTFTHEDVKYACICGMGVTGTKNNSLFYGIKYRVELNDGREMIITAHVNGGLLVTTSFIEDVLF